MKRRRLYLCLVVVLSATAACKQKREAEALPPTYVDDIEQVFDASCIECHQGREAEAGWRATHYSEVIGCNADGVPVTRPASKEAPLVDVLSREDHADLLDAATRRALVEWVAQETPKFRGSVHETGVMDPRSAGWHGSLAATDGWSPLADAAHPLNCGRCHAGAPSRPEEVTSAAADATACTSCHDEPEGALGCATCHGGGARSYPPRDACYFDPALEGGAHDAHENAIQVRAEPFACGACHPTPGADSVFEGPHADGTLDLAFDPDLAGEEASYDDQSGSCAVDCHARGGSVPAPTWEPRTQALDCNGCHTSPPAEHYPGDCSLCHAEMGKTADSLDPGPLHLNGQADLGDGTGRCGSCHGDGDAGWPEDAVHSSHRSTQVTRAVDCGDCHRVPEDPYTEGHLNGVVEVQLSGRADGPGLTPRYTEGTCSEVACHGALGRDPAPDPRWQPMPSDGCSLCHGAPPPPPHAQDRGCAGVICHGGEVAEWPDAPRITDSGKDVHINGEVDAR